METLPPELLERVLDCCDISSLKNLRLVCSQLENASNPRVFEDFHMGFFDEGLQKLCGLAKSKHAKHVKSFTLYPDVLPDWNWNVFEHRVKKSAARLDELKTAAGPMGETRVEHAWQEFERLLQDQCGWRSDVHSLLFREHFSMLPNVATASVIALTQDNKPCKDWPVWKALRQRMLFSPDDWKDLSELGIFRSTETIPATASLCLLEAIAFRSSFSGTKPVTSLIMHTVHTYAYSRVIGGGTLEIRRPNKFKIGPRIRTLAEGFKHLTKLELHIQYDRRGDSTVALKEFLVFLRAAQDLRHLTFKYTTNEVWVPIMSALKQLSLFPPSWPNLHSLHLHVDTMHDELLHLLRSVASTLRSLELHDMIVGDAQALFEQIPKIMKLDTVYVVNLCHVDFPEEDPFIPAQSDMRDWAYDTVLPNGSNASEPYAQAVKAYLLGKSDSLPTLEIDDELDYEVPIPSASEHGLE